MSKRRRRNRPPRQGQHQASQETRTLALVRGDAEAPQPTEHDTGALVSDPYAVAQEMATQGRFKEAAEAILALPNPTPEALLAAGLYLSHVEEFEQASVVFARANAAAPTSWGLYQEARALTRGNARFGSAAPPEDEAKAVALLEAVTQMADCPAEAFDMLERRLSQADRRDAERRVAVLRRGVQVTDDPILRLKLALALDRWIKEPDEALEVLTPLLALPDPPAAARWLAFNIHRDSGRHTEALAMLDGIVVHDDDRAALNVTRGLVLDDLERHDEALQLYSAVAGGEGEAAVAAGLLCLRALLARDVPDIEQFFRVADDTMAAWFASEYVEPVAALYLDVPSWYLHTVEMPSFKGVLLSVLLLMEGNAQHSLTRARVVYYLLRERYEPFGEAEAPRKRLPLREDDVRAAVRCLAGNHRCHETWAEYFREIGDVPEMVRHRLRGLLVAAVQHPSTLEHARYVVLGDDFLPAPDSTPAATWRAVHAALIDLVEEFRPTGALDAVFGPLYTKHWQRFLDHHGLEAEHDEALDALTEPQWGPPVSSALFRRGYRAHIAGRLSDAAADYVQLIALVEDPVALFNLSLIREREGALEEALTLAQRASQADPTDTTYTDRVRKLATPTGQAAHGRGAGSRRGRRGTAGRGATGREAVDTSAGSGRAASTLPATDGDAFLRTAPERWPLLDRYKRQVLATLHVIDGFSGFAELATYSGVEERYLRGHWRKLVELGMLIDEGDKYEINPVIRPLIERERTHSVATRLIRADDSVAMKPIFNSRREYEVYSILVGLFPNQLVFPNMGLQAVFQYDRMRELLDTDTFGYYLRAQVDFCITSTVSYFPILCFEVDSPWHDGVQQQQRDQRKDVIFQRGGVPLLRVRPHGQPTRDALRMAIVEAVCSAREQMLASDDRIASRYSEIDFTPFTMTALPVT